MAEVVATGSVGGGGRFTSLCAARLSERLGGALVLLTPSCSAALELAVRLEATMTVAGVARTVATKKLTLRAAR